MNANTIYSRCCLIGSIWNDLRSPGIVILLTTLYTYTYQVWGRVRER